MAKYTYYAIDPTSSDAVALNDDSGTPETQVLVFEARGGHERVRRAFVGCSTGFSFETDDAELSILIVVEIQSRSMADIYSKVDALDTAVRGDVSVPGGDGTFSMIVAKDGTTEYGYKKLLQRTFDVNYRPYYRSTGGTDYPLVEAPYFTQVTIEATSAYTKLYQLT